MIRGKIVYSGAAKGMAKTFNAAMKQGNEAAVEHWHERYTPEHFKESAGRKYGYQKRSGTGEGPTVQFVDKRFKPARTRWKKNPKYIWRKKREKGHMKPLVFSGRSEAAAKTVRIAGSSRRAAAVFTALPKYMYQYRKDTAQRQPDKAAELVAVTNSEIADLAMVAEKTAAAVMNKASG